MGSSLPTCPNLNALYFQQEFMKLNYPFIQNNFNNYAFQSAVSSHFKEENSGFPSYIVLPVSVNQQGVWFLIREKKRRIYMDIFDLNYTLSLFKLKQMKCSLIIFFIAYNFVF